MKRITLLVRPDGTFLLAEPAALFSLPQPQDSTITRLQDENRLQDEKLEALISALQTRSLYDGNGAP